MKEGREGGRKEGRKGKERKGRKEGKEESCVFFTRVGWKEVKEVGEAKKIIEENEGRK